MTTKKKAAAKKEAPRSASEEFRASANKAVGHQVTWIQYAPKIGLVRVNVERTIDAGDERVSLPGKDVDLPLGELSADIQAAIKDATQWIAEDLGATVIEPDEKEDEE